MDPYYFMTRKGNSKVYSSLQDFHSVDGVIKADAIASARSGDTLISHINKPVRFFIAGALDLIESFQRGPQTIILKDASYIIGKAQITKESTVIDAGTGSGSMAAFFALHAKQVYSYEQREEFFRIADKNLSLVREHPAFCPLSTAHAPFSSATQEADCVFLDMPQAQDQFPHARSLLVDGGHLVVYTPNLTQALECVNALEGFSHDETVEIIVRGWTLRDRVAKPEKDVLHTAFLTFARKTQEHMGR